MIFTTTEKAINELNKRLERLEDIVEKLDTQYARKIKVIDVTPKEKKKINPNHFLKVNVTPRKKNKWFQSLFKIASSKKGEKDG